MNSLTIYGIVTSEPKFKDVNISGENVSLCEMSVFTKNGNIEELFRVNAWREKAYDCIKKVHKGNKILVRGPVSLKKFYSENKQLCANMEIRADYIDFENDTSETEVDKVPFIYESAEVF